MLQRSLDQTGEQRVRLGRAGLELRVGLGGHVERVHILRQLNELGEFAVRALTGNAQSALTQAILVGHVDFVTVAVTLGDMRGAVQLSNQRAFFEVSW